MFNIVKREIEWGGRTLTLETGRIARQAYSVLITYGDTVVMCNVTVAKEPRTDLDFFPLTVTYQEKTYAAGKIPGGFLKREGRPSNKETLTSRLIDRPIRPMFAKGFKNETQIVCTVLSFDGQNDADLIALIGASAALTISPAPFVGPIAAAKIAYIEDEFILNPTIDDLKQSKLDLSIAGTKDSVLMIESKAEELSEAQMLEAVELGLEAFRPIVELIEDFAKEVGNAKWEHKVEDDSKLLKSLEKKYGKDIIKAYDIKTKAERVVELKIVKSKLLKENLAEDGSNEEQLNNAFKNLEKSIVRGRVFKGERIDGRKLDQVRQIESEVSVLPRVHGSALFTRGETQALAVATIGADDEGQFLDSLTESGKDKFMLHYNFPPYSVGETGMLRGPGRREIGHGSLAKKAILPLLPKADEYQNTIRVVSEITESNGSSSMATVCATSMALMNAGVPIKKAVSGIAMGLVKEGEDYKVLSDILGDEDHLGDMDFKVAGSADGITSLQMDIKIQGITFEIFTKALEQARAGRLHILEEMNKTISDSSSELSAYVPINHELKVNPRKIKDVIGQGGKNIKHTCETSECKISVNDDGLVKICAPNQEKLDIAIQLIEDLIIEPEIGKKYLGKVQRIEEYGAFVGFLNDKCSGLIHISEFSEERVESVTDFVKDGQEIEFRIIGKDRDGRLKLSHKAINDDDADYAKGGAKDFRNSRSSGPRKPQQRRDNNSNSRKPEQPAPKPQEAKKKKGFFW